MIDSRAEKIQYEPEILCFAKKLESPVRIIEDRLKG
jgi:hypothetical protein